MLPKYYEFQNPVKINAGMDALETIPYELKQMNASRPIIITDKGITNAGLLKTVLNSFDDSDITIGVVFDETPPDSSLKTVNNIAKLYRKHKCDAIIALGGGSPMDTAKGVNILISENTDDIRKFMGADRLKSNMQPFIAIPTTSGTGSEVTLVAVIYDEENQVKMPFTSSKLLPDVAVLDPRMTMDLPPKITAATGMDALTHAIEAYTCLQKNPMSDAYATAAIKLIGENLLNVIKDGKNKEARFAMANASTMAGIAFSNSMVGAVHAIGHACGAVAHIHHGTAMAILLPYVMEFNNDVLGDLYAELILPLAGADIYAATGASKRSQKFIGLVKSMNQKINELCKMPIRLSEAGLKKEQFEQVAETALNDGAMLPNPKELSKNDVLEVLERAF
ncbi:MAG: iron-containing alcohol dehydrogenase [Bacteroidales bacterium]|nr:iron-containing alcohol dehydrogenase [Bacteroidales bacterium]